jgi:hypothetical protein
MGDFRSGGTSRWTGGGYSSGGGGFYTHGDDRPFGGGMAQGREDYDDRPHSDSRGWRPGRFEERPGQASSREFGGWSVNRDRYEDRLGEDSDRFERDDDRRWRDREDDRRWHDRDDDRWGRR